MHRLTDPTILDLSDFFNGEDISAEVVQQQKLTPEGVITPSVTSFKFLRKAGLSTLGKKHITEEQKKSIKTALGKAGYKNIEIY